MKLLAATFAIMMILVIPAAQAYNYGDHHQQGHYNHRHHHHASGHHNGGPYAQQR
jgi:hypothetical protein